MEHDCDYLTATKRLLKIYPCENDSFVYWKCEINTIASGKCWEDMNWETLGEYVINLFKLELDGVKCDGY